MSQTIEQRKLSQHLYYLRNRDNKIAKSKERYLNNKESISAQKKLYNKKNELAIKAKKKEYRKNNKDKIKQLLHKNYQEHKPERTISHHNYYEDNKQHILAQIKEYRTQNKSHLDEKHKEWVKLNKSDLDEKVRKRRLQLKIDVLTHYGNGKLACVKCGYSNISALSIDHIDGNGAEHRRISGLKDSRRLYSWLKNNNYPEGYQSLCMNCQWEKRYENGETS